MVANPIQKKARNSFLLGVVITLLICAVIAVFFYLLVVRPQQMNKKGAQKVTAYVLSQDVKSGQEITPDLLAPITVYDNMIPANYVDQAMLSTMQLQDEDGNVLYTNVKNELYIKSSNVDNYKKTYDRKNVLVEQDSDGYYKTKATGEKEYIKLLNIPTVAKIDMDKKSVVTAASLTKSSEIVTDDLRYVEYNMISLPMTIGVGDYIDIRITFPSGQDLIVVSKKEVKSIVGDTIGLLLSEGEILMMESAIVENYIISASKLYAIQYIEPGLQQTAIKTYRPTEAVEELIRADGNIKAEAREALTSKFINGMREYINAEKSDYITESQENIEKGIQKEIENAKAAREAYLSGLTSY